MASPSNAVAAFVIGGLDLERAVGDAVPFGQTMALVEHCKLVRESIEVEMLS